MLNESWAINAYCRPQFVSNVAESPALKHFPSIAACPVTCHAGARKRPAISFNRVDFQQPDYMEEYPLSQHFLLLLHIPLLW